MTADHPTPAEHEYVDGSGNIWTYHPTPRDSFTRGPGDTGGNYAHWWVVDRYGPLTPARAAAALELARRDAALAGLTRQRDEAAAKVERWRAWNEPPSWQEIAEEITKQRDELRAQLERQTPVIEAARAWRVRSSGSILGNHERPLAAAVDALGPVDPEASE